MPLTCLLSSSHKVGDDLFNRRTSSYFCCVAVWGHLDLIHRPKVYLDSSLSIRQRFSCTMTSRSSNEWDAFCICVSNL